MPPVRRPHPACTRVRQHLPIYPAGGASRCVMRKPRLPMRRRGFPFPYLYVCRLRRCRMRGLRTLPHLRPAVLCRTCALPYSAAPAPCTQPWRPALRPAPSRTMLRRPNLCPAPCRGGRHGRLQHAWPGYRGFGAGVAPRAVYGAAFPAPSFPWRHSVHMPPFGIISR